MATTQKIGIFAGSFDPIHSGHITCAQAALDELGLHKLYFVVEPRPRYKQGVKAFEHRSAMVRLAIKDMPSFGDIVIDDPYCTTAETLPMLRKRFTSSELYLLMGDDVAQHIADWSNVATLLEHVRLAVVPRRFNKDGVMRRLERLRAVSKKPITYHVITQARSSLSSSDVRKQIKTHGKSGALHPRVQEYIYTHNLYGSSGLGS